MIVDGHPGTTGLKVIKAPPNTRFIRVRTIVQFISLLGGRLEETAARMIDFLRRVEVRSAPRSMSKYAWSAAIPCRVLSDSGPVRAPHFIRTMCLCAPGSVSKTQNRLTGLHTRSRVIIDIAVPGMQAL